MPDISRLLLLIAALAPVALAGCASTGTETSASFNLAPTDHVLPETVSVLPSPSGEVSVASYVQPASVSGAASAVQAAAAVKTPETASASAAVAAAKPADAGAGPTAAAAPKPVETATAMPANATAKPAETGKVPAVVAIGKPTVVAAKPAVTQDKTKALSKFPEAPAPVAYASASDANVPVTLASYLKPNSPTPLDQLIAKYAALYEVPVDLVRRVVKRESNFNPAAFNRGHYGLMQIKHATARGMGYQGSAKGLFDAETNLKYAVKYLRGAYMVAQGNHDRADRLYQSGYYYHAKRMGLLDETGVGKDRVRRRSPST